MAAPVKNGFSCTTIRNLKAATKQQKVSDEKGLYLLVTPTGGKLWRMNYRFDGKQKTLSLGSYPDVSLKEARNRRDEARKVIANGEDPGAIKQAQKAATKVARKNTFEAAARDWYEEWSKGVTPGTAEHTWSILRRRVFPALGSVPVAQIKLKAILDVLREFEAAGVSNAVKKAKVAISQIMAKAVEDEKAERNPVKDMRRGAFDFRVKKHHAAITTPVEVGALLRAID
ncbi:MAG: Arm DNA-binding domain-containing protein, partial [Azoarcus sp.]|nr:Arm DNA-binding domain-containing protein [Azoarcus sp.]